ncbi:component of IIS longevity pathway SMK-1-domain-containing protein [Chytridium lagenaria]|nr:component of IIS longevity pathway SMK-1-domain-containing protein [Chytridium lagenaria]
MTTDQKKRVKVYELAPEGAWVDKGTGQVTHQYVEIKDAMCIVVRSEEDGTVLLNSKIRKEDIYHRQQSTLIVWTEQNGLDLALSFQEAEGCNELWNIITEIQKRLVAVNGENTVTDIEIPSNADSSDEVNGNSDDFRGAGSLSLPKPCHSNLREIEQAIAAGSRTPSGRSQLAHIIIQENFIEKLLALLSDLEDLESTDDLYCLSSVMKMIIFLNDSSIYELVLQDSVFLNVVGILEYDKEFSNAKANHRRYLTETAHFKEVLPIKSPEIVQKIKQTYRIQFLKDVVLARLLDDSTFSALNSLVFFNHMDIVGYFQQDNEYLEGLFRILTSEEYSQEKKKEVVLFLHEISTIAKNLQISSRAAFYRALGQHGLFAIFEYTLADEDISIRLAATAILWSILEHDPALIRSFCVAQVKQKTTPLIEFIVTRFLNESDTGVKSQLADIIRVLLDTSGADVTDGVITHTGTDSDSEEFLNNFYESFMAKLAAPVLNLDSADLTNSSHGSEYLPLPEALAATCSHICELLCFAVKQHSYRSKYYILGSAIIQKTLLLLKAKDTYVRLAALRVLRVCVGMKDEFYNRHLVKNDVFGPILVAFRSTNGRYNLLNSACLDLFEFIRKENVKGLISNIVQNHKSLFEDVTYVDTFKSLTLRHEQNSENPTSGPINGSADAIAVERKERDGWARVDHDEEAYFEGNDEDDDTLSESSAITSSVTSPLVSPLVNYPDDDENEEDQGVPVSSNMEISSPSSDTSSLKRVRMDMEEPGDKEDKLPVVDMQVSSDDAAGDYKLQKVGAGASTEVSPETVIPNGDNASVVKRQKLV